LPLALAQPRIEDTLSDVKDTHCQAGHDLSDAYVIYDGGRERRLCRPCQKRRMVEYRARKKGRRP